MISADNNHSRERPEHLADEVNYLAGEVKLLAINLAITLAKIKGREKALDIMEPRFTELIKKANDTSQQVSNALRIFQDQKRMVSSLPASTEVIERRGAYDCLEAKLNHVDKLSREIMETISKIKRQKQVG